MAVAAYYDNVGETTDTTGTGTITLTNTAVAGRRVFPAAADGDTVIYAIDVNGSNDWEVGYGVYANTGRTLTRNLLASSTGSLISLTGTGHKVAITVDAYRMNIMNREARGHIRGVGYNRNTTTAIQIETGEIVINGTLHEITAAFTTKTTGSDALAADALFHIYITDDSGTIKQHWEKWVSTSDDPVYDTDLDYWKHPSSGADYRYIGSFQTDGSSLIHDFAATTNGRDVEYNSSYPDYVASNITTSQSFSIAGRVPAAASHVVSNPLVNSSSGSGRRYVIFRDTSSTGARYGFIPLYCVDDTGMGGTLVHARQSDTIYATLGPSSGAYYIVIGWRIRR